MMNIVDFQLFSDHVFQLNQISIDDSIISETADHVDTNGYINDKRTISTTVNKSYIHTKTRNLYQNQ